MKDEKALHDYLIKLSGKAVIPQSLKIGYNYTIKADGTITKIIESDNDDGSHQYVHQFKSVLMEILDEKGERIKAKDTRRISQRIRARIYVYWKENQINQDFEEFYQRIGEKIILNFDEIADFVLK